MTSARKVLFVLLSLVGLSCAVETCNKATITKVLRNAQPKRPLLKTLTGIKKLWVATGDVTTGSANNHSSVVVEFSAYDGKTANSLLTVYVNGTKTQPLQETYKDLGDHIQLSSGARNVYYFKCSANLLAVYRCQPEGKVDTVQTGSYIIYAPWSKTEAAIKAELTLCKKAMEKLSPSIVWATRTRPCDK